MKSRHTQQRFVLWLSRLRELANPWKCFKSLVMFWSQPFSLAVLLGVSPLREAVFGVPRPWFPVSARDVVGPDPARSIVVQIEKCKSSFVTFFQSIAFSLACVVLVCFSLVFLHTSHMMSHRTWFRALDHLSLFGYVSL